MSEEERPSSDEGSTTDPDVEGADSGTEPSSEADTGPGQPTAAERRGFLRRHLALVSLAALLIVLAGTAGSFLWWLNHQIGEIPRAEMGVIEDPKKNHNEGGRPLNILLLGADNGEGGKGPSVAEDLADGEWTPFAHRSDTIMIAHIPADRKSVQLVSIPRDTWLPIDGYPSDSKRAKINAAFAYGGPSLSLTTVEQLTGIAIDHVAIIDWVGFKDLTTALGGVRVYIPETFYDTSQKITWEKGWNEYEGQKALAYVRTRYGLENGDFDRIKRQQNFMRATMGKLLSGSTTRNPFKLTKVVGVVTRYLTVDKTWDTDEIRSLALDMRDIKTNDVDFVTAPFGRYDTSADGQSIVRLAPKQSKDLWAAIEDDDIESYLKEYPEEKLADKTSVD